MGSIGVLQACDQDIYGYGNDAPIYKCPSRTDRAENGGDGSHPVPSIPSISYNANQAICPASRWVHDSSTGAGYWEGRTPSNVAAYWQRTC